jgi:predicted DNA-binding protein
MQKHTALIRISEEQFDRLKAYCEKEGRKMTTVADNALKEYLDKKEE